MQVVHKLASRLKLGGVWYYTGDHVQLDAQDALALQGRGLSSPAQKGAKPKNVKEEPADVIKAEQIGIVVKDENVQQAEEIFRKEQVRGHGKRNR